MLNQYKTTQHFNCIIKELIINKNNLIIIHIYLHTYIHIYVYILKPYSKPRQISEN